jgi:hypothetical protein
MCACIRLYLCMYTHSYMHKQTPVLISQENMKRLISFSMIYKIMRENVWNAEHVPVHVGFTHYLYRRMYKYINNTYSTNRTHHLDESMACTVLMAIRWICIYSIYVLLDLHVIRLFLETFFP